MVDQAPERMSAIRELWLGILPLPVAFWIYYAIGNVVVVFALVFLVSLFPQQIREFGSFVAILLRAAYLFVSSVGVWRSSAPVMASPIYIERLWRLVARGVVLGWAWHVVSINLRDFGWPPH